MSDKSLSPTRSAIPTSKPSYSPTEDRSAASRLGDSETDKVLSTRLSEITFQGAKRRREAHEGPALSPPASHNPPSPRKILAPKHKASADLLAVPAWGCTTTSNSQSQTASQNTMIPDLRLTTVNGDSGVEPFVFHGEPHGEISGDEEEKGAAPLKKSRRYSEDGMDTRG
jgi:hypothetical protein